MYTCGCAPSLAESEGATRPQVQICAMVPVQLATRATPFHRVFLSRSRTSRIAVLIGSPWPQVLVQLATRSTPFIAMLGPLGMAAQFGCLLPYFLSLSRTNPHTALHIIREQRLSDR